MAGKFVLKKMKNGQVMFNLKASNGQIILTSESYKSMSAAEAGIESVRKNAAADGRYERKTTSKGAPFFVLKAANGEPIGRSETYSSNSTMENGIASVKKNAPKAAVVKPA